ncbi:MAG: Asp-tRNA(Asn)/Glu-tRNA(Gln) amidotransferase subunit GatA [Bacteroidota bacterium]
MTPYTSLEKIQQALRSGELSCQVLVDHYLQQIEKNEALNAYIEVFGEEARARALELDAQYQRDPNSVGRLFGAVISIKDLLCYKDHEVNGGSKILEGFTALYSATAVERLLAEDAIIIGRNNCDQFGMGSASEHSHFGPVRNAADPTRIAGGSSGGSAVAVQAQTCLASIGTDTGGSVRQPAALCGVVGVKPSYGRISRYGLLAYASSFDQIGVLAHNVADAALLLEIMAGPDEFDSTASQQAVPAYSQQLDFSTKAKIAYFEPALNHPKLDAAIKAGSLALIEQLKTAGHTVEAVDFDYLEYMVPAYYVLTTAEASSNLSRYDGIRYGHRSTAASNLLETYQKSRTEGFGKEAKRRIMLGTFVLSAGYYDAYYTKAQKVRRLVQQQTFEILENYDFILMPVTTSTAWAIGEKVDDPVENYLADIYTVQANMAGIPAVSLPLGQHSDGLPFGIQILGNRFKEADLLAFSYHLSKEFK